MIVKTIKENKIELKFHIFTNETRDYSWKLHIRKKKVEREETTQNDNFTSSLHKFCGDIINKKISEKISLEKKTRVERLKDKKEEYSIEDLFENSTKYYFTVINNQEIGVEESGLKKIFDLLSKTYDDIKFGVSVDLKHKMVYEIIEKYSVIQNENEKSQDNENEKSQDDSEEDETSIPFVEVSFIRSVLHGIELGKKVEGITFVEGEEEDEDDKKVAIEANQNLEKILLDLNKFGVIIYFNDPSLKDVVVADPRWFNKVFKSMIDIGRRKIQGFSYLFFFFFFFRFLKNLLLICLFSQKNYFILLIYNKKLGILENIQLFLVEHGEEEPKIVENIESDFFVSFQTNDIIQMASIKETPLTLLSYLIKWAKGKADDSLSFEDIWNDDVEKMKSNVDKISFTTLLVFTNFLKKKLENQKIFDQLFEEVFESEQKDLSQLFLQIDENELEAYIIQEILGSNFRQDMKKKDFMIEILVKFDFLLLKGRTKFSGDRHIIENREYLIPLLFPKNKPDSIFINDSSNQKTNISQKTLSSQIFKKNQWEMLYYLPFKPSALWKMLFIRIRNACVQNETIFEMFEEYYWMTG